MSKIIGSFCVVGVEGCWVGFVKTRRTGDSLHTQVD